MLLVGGLLSCGRGSATSSDTGVFVPSPSAVAPDGQSDAGVAAAVQVDRAGRPLVAVLLVGGSLQDTYNASSTFDSPVPRTLLDALASRIQALDTITLADGAADPVDWSADGGAATLASILGGDALLIDTALPCASADGGFLASYLDLEREMFFDGSAHRTCGGRTPGDNVVDAMLTLVITGGRAAVVQGVSGPTKAATTSFPYLAAPTN
jgi:hypothetical protein